MTTQTPLESHETSWTLFDPPAANAARDAAIAQVEQAADERWKALAMSAVKTIASQQASLTTDDVWEWLHREGVTAPPEPRALGAIMKKAAGTKLIRSTMYTEQSARERCHARPLRVWTSLVYRGA